MKNIALIPARYAATRFPGKLMQDLAGKSVILRTYEAVHQTNLFDEVLVVCDSEMIYNEINGNGGKAIYSLKDHQCGTDRIAEAAANFPNAEIIINIQGDEPFTQKEDLKNLIHAFQKDPDLKVASLMHLIRDEEEINNPNNVKVAVDQSNFALLFSRSPIPFHRNKKISPIYYKHIGIYAFRKQMLLDFPKLPITPLEDIEQLEGLRYLEHGIKMKMVLSKNEVIGIDTPEDLELAKKILS